jgi:hypothetical protein
MYEKTSSGRREISTVSTIAAMRASFCRNETDHPAALARRQSTDSRGMLAPLDFERPV